MTIIPKHLLFVTTWSINFRSFKDIKGRWDKVTKERKKDVKILPVTDENFSHSYEFSEQLSLNPSRELSTRGLEGIHQLAQTRK